MNAVPLGTPDIAALKKSRLHDAVVGSLLARIVSGRIPAGDLLPSEPELCEELGVSRTVVRQAIGVLGSKGLISVEHGRGSRVNPPHEWAPFDKLIIQARVDAGDIEAVVSDLVEVRRMWEIEVAGLAAQRADGMQIEAIVAALAAMEASEKDASAFTSADIAFHQALAAATGNNMLRALQDPIVELLGAGLAVSVETTFDEAIAHHRRVLEAVRDNDVEEARRAMRVIVDNWERIHKSASA